MKRMAWSNRTIWWALGIAGWLAISLAALALILFVNWYQQSAVYPGSLVMGSDHTIYKLSPVPTVRQDSAYRSTDAFGKVYNFYSSGFELGPESYAQSTCILMAHSFTDFWVIRRQMTVTLCDTPQDRMIFVMRSLELRWH